MRGAVGDSDGQFSTRTERRMTLRSTIIAPRRNGVCVRHRVKQLLSAMTFITGLDPEIIESRL